MKRKNTAPPPLKKRKAGLKKFSSSEEEDKDRDELEESDGYGSDLMGGEQDRA